MACVDEDPDETSAYEISAHELGRRGEEAAVRYLERIGMDIVERNWSCPFGEADIIAIEDGTLVFVEVKTRRSVEAGLPEEAITAAKRHRYEIISMLYLNELDLEIEIPIRFDAIAICVTKKNRALLRHHRSCFDACI